jgi:hypothetical protein
VARFDYNPVPEVAPTGAPGGDYFRIQSSPEAFGAPVGRGLQTLGQGVEKAEGFGFDILQFHDKVATDSEVNNYIDERNKALYGDPNKTVTGPDGTSMPDTGFMGLTGRAALDGQQAALDRLQDARQRGLSNLTSPEAKLRYENETRRMFAEAQAHIGQHAEQQQKVWAQGVNSTGADINLNAYASSVLNSPALADASYHRFIDAQVKQAQLKFGNDPGIVQDTIENAKRVLLETQVNAIAVKDPAGALQFLEKPENKAIAGAKYDDIYDRLRSRSQVQNGVSAANKYIADATGLGGAGRTYARSDVANSASAAWRNAGMSGNGIAGVMFNINEESGFNPSLRHPDQPRYEPTDERHYAHGLYQEGAEEWSRYEGWIRTNHPGADWRDPSLQSEFAAWNLKTNYPGTWARMNAAATPEEAAAIYAREYLKPAAVNLQSRLAKIGQGVSGVTPAVATSTAAPAGPDRHLQLAEALRGLESDPNLDDHEREVGRQRIQQEFRLLEIMDNQSAKAKKEASDTAASNYVTSLADALRTPGSDLVALQGRIAHDPNLTWETKQHLLDRVAKYSGEEQRIGFGAGFFDAKQRILSEPGTPGHIGSIDDILRLPDNAVTMQGQHELVSIFNAVKREDQMAVAQARAAVEAGVKVQMVRPESFPGYSPKDVKGEIRFNMKFLPMFNAAYNEWVKAGKDPFEFLRDQKRIEAMMEQAYPRTERQNDAMSDAGTYPAAPQGVNETEWKNVLNNRPTINGNPMPLKNWANAVGKLLASPTSETVAALDGRLTDTGFKAIDILRTLNPAAATALEKTGVAPETMAATPAAVGAPNAERAPPVLPELRIPPELLLPSAAAAPPPVPTAGMTPEQRRAAFAQQSEASREAERQTANVEDARRYAVSLQDRLAPLRAQERRTDLPIPVREHAAKEADAIQGQLDNALGTRTLPVDTAARSERFRSERVTTLTQHADDLRQQAGNANLSMAARLDAVRRMDQTTDEVDALRGTHTLKTPMETWRQRFMDDGRAKELAVDIPRYRAAQDQPGRGANQREAMALHADAGEAEMRGIDRRRRGDMAGAATEDELAALARREAALWQSGLAGAFRQAQLKKIEERKRELEAKLR